jgi:hypothetical protein
MLLAYITPGTHPSGADAPVEGDPEAAVENAEGDKAPEAGVGGVDEEVEGAGAFFFGSTETLATSAGGGAHSFSVTLATSLAGGVHSFPISGKSTSFNV